MSKSSSTPKTSRFSPLNPKRHHHGGSSSPQPRPSCSRSLLRNLDGMGGQSPPAPSARQENDTPPVPVQVISPSYFNSCSFLHGRAVWNDLRLFTVNTDNIILNAERLETELEFDLVQAVTFFQSSAANLKICVGPNQTLVLHSSTIATVKFHLDQLLTNLAFKKHLCQSPSRN